MAYRNSMTFQINVSDPLDGRSALTRRAWVSLAAGAIAISINTALLAGADHIPLVTARGGLLKLLNIWVGRDLARLGIGTFWARLGLPMPGGTAFQLGFHVVVGVMMALLYGLALEPMLRGTAWAKGLAYAVLVWLANSVVILPLLGEGFAGSRDLGLPGIVYFAVAHTIFFVLTAVLFARFLPVPTRRIRSRSRLG